MHGSPTVLIDGRDPFAGPGDGASMSCRLYRDEQGRVQGAPSTGQLRAALAEADCCEGEAPAAMVGGDGGGWPWAGSAQCSRRCCALGRDRAGPDAAELEAVAAPLGVPARAVLAVLAAGDFPTLDEDGQVDAAYQFSARPTGIEVTLPSGVTVASMCAIEALGIAAMLGSYAVIDSASSGGGSSAG